MGSANATPVLCRFSQTDAKMDLTGGGVAAFSLVFGIDLVPAVLEFDLNFWFKKLDQTMRRFRFA